MTPREVAATRSGWLTCWLRTRIRISENGLTELTNNLGFRSDLETETPGVRAERSVSTAA